MVPQQPSPLMPTQSWASWSSLSKHCCALTWPRLYSQVPVFCCPHAAVVLRVWSGTSPPKPFKKLRADLTFVIGADKRRRKIETMLSQKGESKPHCHQSLQTRKLSVWNAKCVPLAVSGQFLHSWDPVLPKYSPIMNVYIIVELITCHQTSFPNR